MGSTSTLENVLYEKKGAIAYVTINRPKVLNAQRSQYMGSPINLRRTIQL